MTEVEELQNSDISTKEDDKEQQVERKFHIMMELIKREGDSVQIINRERVFQQFDNLQ